MRRRRLFDDLTGYGVVLGLIGVTYAVSVTSDTGRAVAAVTLVQLLALRLVLIVSHARLVVRRTADVVIVVVAVAVVFGLAFGEPAQHGTLVTRFVFTASAILYAVAPVSIVFDTIRRPTVDEQTLLAAIAAYLMLGMAFAFTYRLVGELQVVPFFGQTGAETMANYLFFSFVTLTTTGYGNLVPAANPGQSLAVLEAIAGQLFLVTAVAKIVNESGLLSRRRRAVVEGSAVDGAPPEEPGPPGDGAGR